MSIQTIDCNACNHPDVFTDATRATLYATMAELHQIMAEGGEWTFWQEENERSIRAELAKREKADAMYDERLKSVWL